MRFRVFIFTLIIIYSCGTEKNKINRDAKGFESIAGLKFSQSERDSLLPDLTVLKNKYDSLRSLNIPNSIPNPLHFNPLSKNNLLPTGNSNYKFEENKINMPSNIEECAFFTIDKLKKFEIRSIWRVIF